MRIFLLSVLCLFAVSTIGMAQDPGNPSKSDILTESSQEVTSKKKAASLIAEPTAKDAIPIKKSAATAKKIPNSYVVVLNEDFVKPMAAQKSRSSNREAQAAAANKHEAAAIKQIRKYATETLGLSNSEIKEVYAGAVSGFSVKLANKKSGASWMTKTKSTKNTADVFQDEEFELADHAIESVVDTYNPEAWAAQTSSYGKFVANGCDCRNFNKWAWIIDTGIDLNHPDLNVVGGVYAKSFVPGESAEDYRGHGTHVAGIVGAKNNSYGSLGVASGARVVPLKVFPRNGGAPSSYIVAALNHVYKYGIAGDVVNLSLGGSINPSAPRTIVETAIKRLADKGIYVTIAAGNSKRHARGFHPARFNYSKVYTIAATQWTLFWWSPSFASNYSNYGKPPVDYAAPGSSIYAPYKNGGYATLSGTSMAAPNFAGVLLCQIKNKRGFSYLKVPQQSGLYVLRNK
ncbi:MAG: S8 family serine peptidase [Saprospiraceae bacterium]|nr:S8 family serine peptidase [Saprospiraceae bacterium]